MEPLAAPPEEVVATARPRHRMRIATVVVLASLLGGWLVLGTLFDSYRIPSDANAPTLERGDHVLVRHVDGASVHAGDVVIFRAPGVRGVPRIERVSRVLALSGDRVAAADGVLLVDGEAVAEPYLDDNVITWDFAELTIPTGHVWVMSDNRQFAQDSRFFGPVPVDDISARVVFGWWPPSRLGGV